MGQFTQSESSALTVTTGAVIPVEPGVGVKLAATTYFFMLSDADSMTVSAHIRWDAVAAGVVTFEDCNLPRWKGYNNSGVNDVTDIDTTAGNWIKEDPTTAYVPISGGATAANLTVTIAGTTAGGCILNLGNIGTKRGRIKVALTTGGVMRVCFHAKSA